MPSYIVSYLCCAKHMCYHHHYHYIAFVNEANCCRCRHRERAERIRACAQRIANTGGGSRAAASRRRPKRKTQPIELLASQLLTIRSTNRFVFSACVCAHTFFYIQHNQKKVYPGIVNCACYYVRLI